MSIEITDEMVDAYIRGVDAKALEECSENFRPVVRQWVRDGLAAVAPLIAAAEREACAAIADLHKEISKRDIVYAGEGELQAPLHHLQMLAGRVNASGDIGSCIRARSS